MGNTRKGRVRQFDQLPERGEPSENPGRGRIIALRRFIWCSAAVYWVIVQALVGCVVHALVLPSFALMLPSVALALPNTALKVDLMLPSVAPPSIAPMLPSVALRGAAEDGDTVEACEGSSAAVSSAAGSSAALPIEGA